MTPKEKAYDILNKMTCGEGYKKIGSGWSAMLPNNRYYIRCAWIAVDEILKVACPDTFSCKYYDGDFYSDQDYFIQVKKEIEKI